MFPSRLNQTRKARGLTALGMANALHMQIRGYRKYESGDSTPSLDKLTDIADLLNVPVDYLLGRDDYLRSLGVSVDLRQANPPTNPTAR